MNKSLRAAGHALLVGCLIAGVGCSPVMVASRESAGPALTFTVIDSRPASPPEPPPEVHVTLIDGRGEVVLRERTESSSLTVEHLSPGWYRRGDGRYHS